MRKLHGISYEIYVPILVSTSRRSFTAPRTSFLAGGKTGAAGSGTLGSFGCAGSATGGGLGGGGGATAAILDGKYSAKR